MINNDNIVNAKNEIFIFIKAFLKEKRLDQYQIILRPLPADGSKRIFQRMIIAGISKSYIIMQNPPQDTFSEKENYAFLKIGQHLYKQGIPIPEIYAHHLSEGWFILEDQGTIHLQEMAEVQNKRLKLYQQVIRVLIKLQIEGAVDFDPTWTCQTEKYDAFVMRKYEVEYFVENFLFRFSGLKKISAEIENALSYLIEQASQAGTQGFLHRDFQSRNIMLRNGHIGIIDWQGGRFGPPGYDLASLLIDPYVSLSSDERHRLYICYLNLLEETKPEWRALFERTYPYLAIQRNLQILGAFSFLSMVRKKTYFAAYIPKALESLRCLLKKQNESVFAVLKALVDSLKHS